MTLKNTKGVRAEWEGKEIPDRRNIMDEHTGQGQSENKGERIKEIGHFQLLNFEMQIGSEKQ